MPRVAFLVDGYNLYHSLGQASHDLGGAGTKWLDLPSLCRSFLPAIDRAARLECIVYFSALANHAEQRRPGSLERHTTYIRALTSRGVAVELGKFKEKWKRCPQRRSEIVVHEEKETDVAIAVRLMELLWRDQFDAAVLVSADSDL